MHIQRGKEFREALHILPSACYNSHTKCTYHLPTPPSTHTHTHKFPFHYGISSYIRLLWSIFRAKCSYVWGLRVVRDFSQLLRSNCVLKENKTTPKKSLSSLYIPSIQEWKRGMGSHSRNLHSKTVKQESHGNYWSIAILKSNRACHHFLCFKGQRMFLY